MQPRGTEELWEKMKRFWEQRRLSPSDLEQYILQECAERGGSKFFCPISGQIVRCPLKHLESGALFEKASIEQKFKEASTFSFSRSGQEFQITRETLVSSPEDQGKIAEILRKIMLDICSFGEDPTLCSQMQYRERQADTTAIERLWCLWSLVFFVELKVDAWSKIKRFFDLMNTKLNPALYWQVNPKYHLIPHTKTELAVVKAEQRQLFQQPITPIELREALCEAHQSIISGCVNWILFGEYNPLYSVKTRVRGEIDRNIQEVIRANSSDRFPVNSTYSLPCLLRGGYLRQTWDE
jgi:hypothetical protein